MAKTNTFRLSVQMDAQLRRNFRRLPELVRRRIGRSALKPAAELLSEATKDEMQAQDIWRTGEGVASIGYALQLNKLYKDELHAIVGPVAPRGWYLHFIEFGTGPRKGRGQVPAKPFMEPAFNRVMGEIQALIAERLRVGIAKAVAK